MATRTIMIDGLNIQVERCVRKEKVYKGFLAIETGRYIKKVVVQYGIGVSGVGATLKEAVADFRDNWASFERANKSWTENARSEWSVASVEKGQA